MYGTGALGKLPSTNVSGDIERRIDSLGLKSKSISLLSDANESVLPAPAVMFPPLQRFEIVQEWTSSRSVELVEKSSMDSHVDEEDVTDLLSPSIRRGIVKPFDDDVMDPVVISTEKPAPWFSWWN